MRDDHIDPNELSITRRELVRRGIGGAAGVILPTCLSPGVLAQAAPAIQGKGKAKSVIQIWMWGGPSHTDLFDPKPDAGSDFTGPLNHPIGTNVAGMQICELMPELAKQADKYSLIRSMTHGSYAHETAAYMVQTGRIPGDGQVYPGAGAVISLFRSQAAKGTGLIPPYIVLTELQGRFSEAGFLGSRAKPFATGGNPASARFVVEGVVAEGMTDDRQRHRRELLGHLNTLGNQLQTNPEMVALSKCESQAYDLILGDAGKVFDLSLEKTALRERYGMNSFGQSCLMARRLVEKGVPYITVNYTGWDTHKEHFQTMRRKLPEFDKGLASLLIDLKDRGLLDSTVILCGGEFGRTPKVQWEAPWNGGRGHWGSVFSYLVAGGGFRGGQVLGSSDARGEAVKDRPVHPAELIRTLYGLLGIDPNTPLPHPQGLVIPAAPPIPKDAPHGGNIVELL